MSVEVILATKLTKLRKSVGSHIEIDTVTLLHNFLLSQTCCECLIIFSNAFALAQVATK